jgi:hypothetical protein
MRKEAAKKVPRDVEKVSLIFRLRNSNIIYLWFLFVNVIIYSRFNSSLPVGPFVHKYELHSSFDHCNDGCLDGTEEF